MSWIFELAFKSLRNRVLTSVLTVLSIGLSVALFLGVERVRSGARDSFSNTISQTDLIVGARGGTIQLLLYSVFRMGTATGNISVESWETFRDHPAVAWTIPFSLGDSYRGFRVVGTNDSYYEHYRYHGDRKIEFDAGNRPSALFDVVLGSDVARDLDHKVGDRIVVSHGISDVSIVAHDATPFVVTGILARTGTPIDRSVHVTLEGIEALHVDWKDGAPPIRGQETSPEALQNLDLKPSQITAFLLRTKTRVETLRLQREINSWEDEPLMAIIPGVALAELWNGLSYAEDALRVVSIFVILVGLIGMLVALYNSLNERRREMAIFRAVGAGAGTIMALLVIEASLLTVTAVVLGISMTYGALFMFQPIMTSLFGLYVPISLPSTTEWIYLGLVVIFGVLLGVVPALRAYRHTLADGLTLRV